MSICRQCNAPNRNNAKFCQTCGAPQSTQALPSGAPKTRQLHQPSQQGTPKTRKLSPQESAPAPLPAGQSVSQVKTHSLSTSQSALIPLPSGELLEKRRYAVLSIINQMPDQNVYSVWDRWHRHCPQCNSTSSRAEDAFCQNCGADFKGQSIEHPGYLLRETLNQEMLGQEFMLASMGLRHEGIINLHHSFEYRPYGTHPRFYLLSDPDEGTTLVSLSGPQPEEKVLDWGKQLAQALAYLHDKGIRHGNIQLENVRLVDFRAKLTNFRWAEKMPKGKPTTWMAEEVHALGSMLHNMLGEQPLSSSATSIFERLSVSRGAGYATAQALADAIDQALDTLRRPTNITHIVGRLSDVGQERELNEDNLLTLEIEQVQMQSKPIGLYVVADGMGGHAAGEVASIMASQAVGSTIASKVMLPMIEGKKQAPSREAYSNLLKEACMNANRAVFNEGRKRRSDMGTTLVAALVVGHHAYIANIGDSRAYLVEQRGIRPLTTDHSLVERLVATGQISREEAQTHPQRNVIYRTVGDKAKVEVDLIEHQLKLGQWLVLCSDGLHGMITDAHIHQKVISSLHPQEACEELVRMANQAGGDDNITVIVLKLEEMGRKR